jgi:hypothetical protein
MDGCACRHFSLANALDDRPGDLPTLLRRLADEIESKQIASMDILDPTVASETIDSGPWWSASLYWSPS